MRTLAHVSAGYQIAFREVIQSERFAEGCLFCGLDAPIDDAGTCAVRIGPVHPSYETPLSGLSVIFRCHSIFVADAALESHRPLVIEATTRL